MMLLQARLLKSGIRRCNIIFKTSMRVYSSCNPFSTVNNLLHQYQDIELTPFRVENVAGGFGMPFSRALLRVIPYCVDINDKTVDPYFVDYEESKKFRGFSVDFMPLFNDGMKKVASIISPGSEDEIQQKDLFKSDQPLWKLREAVRTLGMFLENKEFHEQCLSDMAKKRNTSYTKLDITTLLVNHLFLPLIAHDPGSHMKYIINSDSKRKIPSCTCAKNCGAEIIYGDSGFGSGYLWYGRSDIMLFPESSGRVGINVAHPVPLLEENRHKPYKQNTDSEVESYMRRLRKHMSVKQVASQAITFSLFQKKYQRENMDVWNGITTTTVIPTIFISRYYFDIYMYDSENDVLLRNLGKPMPIFERKPSIDGRDIFYPKFNLDSVLRLWMLINHLLLHPCLPNYEEHKLTGTCGIRKQIETYNLMKKVEDSLIEGCSHSAIEMSENVSSLKMKL